ncbi:phosphoesterase [Mariprofundus erugo]|uniref:metallophosphoesterase n=1 Tax=Mariprofundus erugo TaxID=2528639 RepID=UPI0010FE4F34|nr:metallophosphoesterase [Mariprofundus erugo]TLS77925.1 phosphoesterase [Mariprofundus erugo]
MRIQVLSDLHLEEHPYIPEHTAADVVVMAGDIGIGAQGVEWAKRHFDCPVIFVAGNHEYHDPITPIALHKRLIKRAACGSNVNVLDDNVCMINGVRFLGCTLWTDPLAPGTILYCDAERIAVQAEPIDEPEFFTMSDQELLHHESRGWLERELHKPFAGKTVVVTHHAPSLQSVTQGYGGHPFTNCYVATNMEKYMAGVDVWIHGHTHNSSDYVIGGCRVVCNPRGYPDEQSEPENRAFDPVKLIEI